MGILGGTFEGKGDFRRFFDINFKKSAEQYIVGFWEQFRFGLFIDVYGEFINAYFENQTNCLVL